MYKNAYIHTYISMPTYPMHTYIHTYSNWNLNETGPGSLQPSSVQGGLQFGQVVGVRHRLHMPMVCRVALVDVLREGQGRVPVDGDQVVVIAYDQLAYNTYIHTLLTGIEILVAT